MDVNTQACFFTNFFRTLKEANCDYVVLHSWQTLPEMATSDVDFLVSAQERSRVEPLIRQAAAACGWRLVQKLWYDVPWCFYFVVVSPNNEVSVAVDFVSDPAGIGEYRIKDSLILQHKVDSGLLLHLTTEMELAYKLAKRRVKGIFSEKDREFVFDYYARSDKAELLLRMKELLPQSFIDNALEFCERHASVAEWQALMSRTSPAFRFAGRRWRIRLHPMWFIMTVRRVLMRMLHPTGFILTVSPDVTVPDFPKFVFRRTKEIRGALSWSQRFCALSSATLIVNRVNERQHAQRNLLSFVLTALERRRV